MKRVLKRSSMNRVNESRRLRRSLRESLSSTRFVAEAKLEAYTDFEYYGYHDDPDDFELDLNYALDHYHTDVINKLKKFFEQNLINSSNVLSVDVSVNLHYERNDVYSVTAKIEYESPVSESYVAEAFNNIVDSASDLLYEQEDYNNYGVEFSSVLVSSNSNVEGV